MDKIKVMVSSTVKDLIGERQCIEDTLSKLEFVEIVGAAPYAMTSVSLSSAQNTKLLAQNCDLYILILGKRFGMERPDGKSATEIEFDAAYHSDPTKILVFLKDSDEEADAKQIAFINRVCDYYNGYWRTTFEHTYQLQELVMNSFVAWLKERASLGNSMTYLDHFIRFAVQKKPEPNAQVYYSVKESYVEMEYHFMGKVKVMHYNKEQIYNNFWGCLYDLDNRLLED